MPLSVAVDDQQFLKEMPSIINTYRMLLVFLGDIFFYPVFSLSFFMSFFICIIVGGCAAIFTETEENHHQRQ